MKIRAHHLLCIKYFQGLGYSKLFVENFYDVLKKLKLNPTIKIINYPDIICEACPNNKSDCCVKNSSESEISIRKKDVFVLTELDLKPEEDFEYNKAMELVENNLNNLRIICKDCEWLNICK
jgi:hypothetical protein